MESVSSKDKISTFTDALYAAIQTQNAELVQLLLDAGVSPNGASGGIY